MDLKNKNIILTGASSGIGAKLLEKICMYEGVRVIAVARSIDTVTNFSDRIIPFQADLSSQEGVDSLFDFAANSLGHIDVFIANAGFAYIEELSEPDWNHIEKIYSLNTTSVIYSLLKFNKQASGNPIQFVCTMSAVAFVPLYAYALYCSSKSALHQFIEAYRYESGDNLTITAIYPVATKTDFFDKGSEQINTPLPWPAQKVETVADRILSGIVKNKKKIYPSVAFRIFYPIGRAFPFLLKIYSLLEKKKMRKWLFNR